MIKSKRREIFRLENELGAGEKQRVVGETEMGALPDFVIIAARKCGTTSLYHLLTRHPLVEPAALKCCTSPTASTRGASRVVP